MGSTVRFSEEFNTLTRRVALTLTAKLLVQHVSTDGHSDGQYEQTRD